MNEIEQHVMTINVMQSAYRHIRHSDAEFLALEAAKEALREKAEREKGCEYCKPLFTGGTNARLLDSNAVFCSRCGKRLEVKQP